MRFSYLWSYLGPLLSAQRRICEECVVCWISCELKKNKKSSSCGQEKKNPQETHVILMRTSTVEKEWMEEDRFQASTTTKGEIARLNFNEPPLLDSCLLSIFRRIEAKGSSSSPSTQDQADI